MGLDSSVHHPGQAADLSVLKSEYAMMGCGLGALLCQEAPTGLSVQCPLCPRSMPEGRWDILICSLATDFISTGGVFPSVSTSLPL